MFLQDVAKPVFDIAKTDQFEKLEKAFIILYMILFSRGVITLVLTGGSSEGDGSGEFDFGIFNLFWMLNYLVTAGLFVVKWDAIKERLSIIILNNYFYWVFIMFLMLSMVWSEKPDETIKASIGMIGTAMFGVYIVSRFNLREQIKLWSLLFTTIILLSLLMMAVPGYGVETAKHAGAIRGIYSHKNIFGPIMALSCTTFLIYAKTNFCSNKRLAYLGCLVSFAMVVGSRSSSSLMYTLLLLLLVHTIEILRLRGKLFVWALITLGGLYFFVSAWGNTIAIFILELLGKDPTLTGRTDIWAVIMGKIQERPWLGYGFDGFWHGIYGESLYVRNALMWDLPNSHNGFLDLTLGIGIVGMAILALAAWVTFIKGIALLKTHFAWEHTWAVVYIFYLFMINMSESSLANQNDMQTVFMTVVFTSMSVEFNHLFSPTQSGSHQLT